MLDSSLGPGAGTATSESESNTVDSRLGELEYWSSCLVSELGEIGALLSSTRPTSVELIWRLQLGLIQAQALSLAAGIKLLRDLRAALADL